MNATPVIAIVDDDAAVRHAMGRLLRALDLAVELYAGGPELLASPTLDRIACVIADVQMPGMSGFALSDALRARGLRTPVIFMTAFDKQGYEARAQAAGAACFIGKPFADTEIIRCIERALGLPGDAL
ncbi:response regulator transcription factor [Cupriavidus taiwanensis]|uniref:Putative two-component response regulator receiver n=1 Tax=Cupriavidus taiwanensis TaxID=164546 RepID=A0A375GFF8_9BURK|nr:response regulator [Cupriavidus taiwanensis]SOY71081.1 putative two-component response regulator receiver [Cupriavidus taiwanensis]SOZ09722.1 putative two-component response regulator receiver [Cupriavidus taiwanensis]SOZ11841.1 putative two-component response regulator receiver [Cupriavidus taiwanensis]SOZ43196.1 putative two-component response regulator receiver [Cupriavidus taiwanensis]SPC18153.1 putative two-component response regulator receiver [Cupriavidus taiwanensis]